MRLPVYAHPLTHPQDRVALRVDDTLVEGASQSAKMVSPFQLVRNLRTPTFGQMLWALCRRTAVLSL
eukprot:8341643-Alexandrium_andersonii.AAC.1